MGRCLCYEPSAFHHSTCAAPPDHVLRLRSLTDSVPDRLLCDARLSSVVFCPPAHDRPSLSLTCLCSVSRITCLVLCTQSQTIGLV